MNLKHGLCDIETDCRYRLHAGLLRIVGASTAPRFMALSCRWGSRPQHQKRSSASQIIRANHSELSQPGNCAILARLPLTGPLVWSVFYDPLLLRCSGKEMIDDRKDDEKRDADAKAPADELFLGRQERL